MKPEQLQLINYNSMVELFHSESDRGAAVLAGSYVENVLGIYLSHQMTDKSLSDSLFNSNGPLSTFSQRITISQAFGFITKDTADTLNYIRKIRNYFAHHPLEASFEKSPASNWVDNLIPLLQLREDQEEIRNTMSRRVIYLISCGFFSASTHVKMGDRGSHA